MQLSNLDKFKLGSLLTLRIVLSATIQLFWASFGVFTIWSSILSGLTLGNAFWVGLGLWLIVLCGHDLWKIYYNDDYRDALFESVWNYLFSGREIEKG